MLAYNDMMYASTLSEYETKSAALKQHSNVLVDYLDKHWLKYKDYLARCWTQRYRHYGCQTMSVVERNHAKRKKWLASSRGDFRTAFKRLKPW